MKTKSIIATVFLFSLLLATLVSAEEIATTRNMAPMLGQGYLTERQSLAGECLTGEPVWEGRPEASVAYSSTISEQRLASELGISAGLKARINVVDVGAAATFYNASQSDAFSVSAIYAGTYFFKNQIFKNPQLKPEFQNYMENLNSDKWREACGDEFVVQRQLGAKLFFSIRVDFASEEERRSFSANFSLSAPLVSVNAAVSHALSSMSKRTRVTVNVLQIGGKVDRITEIFQSHNKTAQQNGGSDAYRFVQCSSGELNQCQRVLERAIQYATDTENGFPSQISPDFLKDANAHGGPAVLSSTTTSYRVANIFFDITPELDKQTKLARQSISRKYEDAYGQYRRTVRLVQDGVVRLSDNQRDRFRAMETNLYASLQKITESSLRCYQYPKQCSDAYEDLSETLPEGVRLYKESDFVIEPETFAQYCDLGVSPLSQKSLANTIDAMLDRARELSPDVFAPPYEGASVDECSAAETIFKRTNRIDFEGREIEDLRPLAVLRHLKELSLRGTSLSSIDQLAHLRNLEVLNLSNNQLVNVDELNALSALRELDLSDNRISDASSMAMMSRLKKLDLRNNEAEVICPFYEKERCIIADFRTNNSFIGIRKTTVTPRVAHAAAKLLDDRILIVGGKAEGFSSAIRAEIFDARNGEFHFIGEMVRSRNYHTATTLGDGSVLVVGGLGRGAIKSAELFLPQHEAFFPTQGTPIFGRALHTATRLLDGRVLIIGGFSNEYGIYRGGDATLTTEIYDPVLNNFIQGPSIGTPRGAHRATLLADGRVLVTGGEGLDASLTTAEIYDANENRWRRVKGRMHVGRSEHVAILLKDGRVLVAGGFDARTAVDRAEIFDPKTEVFVEVKNRMNAARAEHEGHLLSDGRVVLLGGRCGNYLVEPGEMEVPGTLGTAEIFDPITQLFTQSPKKMSAPRASFSSIELEEDRILLVGGLGGVAEYSAELFEYSP